MKVHRTDQNGYMIWCPACQAGHHLKDETWTFNGDVERPTFTPSIAVTWGKKGWPNRYICHSIVCAGTIQYLDDCTHALVGKVVDLPDFPSEATATPAAA